VVRNGETRISGPPQVLGLSRASPERRQPCKHLKEGIAPPSGLQSHTELEGSRDRARSESGPALLKRERERAQARQNRVADAFTAFSGSMLFVYLHVIWFGCWIGFGVEDYPYGLLTMIVSLEAIFLSSFVMISQNRADGRRQVIADEQWRMAQEEDNKTSSCSTSRGKS
jgi:uncharacterized membrane protein